MKQKWLVLVLLILAMLAFYTLSSAATTDPIVCTMEVSPSALSEPGDVTITISVSNSGDTDMKYPLTLFDPTSKVVTDFGDEGSVTLKAGEVKTWTGTWSVNQRTLENGQIVFFVKYTLEDEDKTTKSQSQPIRGKIEQSNYSAKISVTRTITPQTAREGQTVSVIYDIVNDGNVSITNLALQENKDILSDKLTIAAELKAGETAQVKLPVVMGKKDLTSEATITYTIADGTQEQTYQVDKQTITYGEPAVLATLTADSKGVLQNETIKLTIELNNTGNVDYTDVRITDPNQLGDIFTNQTLPAGEKLTLEKEITLTQSADYQFEVRAIDSTGTEEIFYTNTVSLVAVDPNNALNLSLTLTSNKTEVYSDQEVVRFTVSVTNDSDQDATNVTLYQSKTEIYTFASIPKGTTKTLSRDVTLSMAGKFQFRAEATDALENTLSFESNILQIAFLTPTPAPVTVNPNITSTPEPTFVKATYPRISDPDIGTLPKLIRTFFYPLMLAGFVLLIVALIILAIASKKRMEIRKLSENALDHLERSNHRDYVVPADIQEHASGPDAQQQIREEDEPQKSAEQEDSYLAEEELPHMKYVRNAYQIAGRDSARKEDMADDYYGKAKDTYGEYTEETWKQDQSYRREEDEESAYRRTEEDDAYRRTDDEESPYQQRIDEAGSYQRADDERSYRRSAEESPYQRTNEENPYQQRADEESPYRRRSERVSPYARQSGEQRQDDIAEPYDDPQE